ncbi:MAG: shikimate kinase AroL [Pseudodesulfovibrio sp.]
MQPSRTIFLIGPRGCGKTSLGSALARRLGLAFVDTDHELVREAGMEIADFVEVRGWEAFRDLEAETLACVAAGPVRVVGCGGGIVLRGENRAVLARGTVIYLQVGPEELARRLMADPNEAQRPSLTGKGLVEEIREVLEQRAPLYEECADIVLPPAGLPDMVESAVRELAEFTERF